MARPIAPTPVLTGKEAAKFLTTIHENSNKPVTLTPTPKIAQAYELVKEYGNRKKTRFIDSPWILRKIENRAICKSFDCGDNDLNEYFRVDAVLHKKELLTVSYCLQAIDVPNVAVALLDFCNDAVQLRKFEDKIEIDPSKNVYPYLPAVKLTRFGVAKQFQRKNIGSKTLNMIKKLFVTDNRTGCRFSKSTVDALNEEGVLKFYEKNGFIPISRKDIGNETRALFVDLKRPVIGLVLLFPQTSKYGHLSLMP